MDQLKLLSYTGSLILLTEESCIINLADNLVKEERE